MGTVYSLHKINQVDSFGFSPADYSRFKYGDDAVAEQFGVALANGFIAAHLSQKKAAKQLVVISSPYSFIPTATFSLKNHFIFTLNRWLAKNDLPVVQETKVDRTVTYKEDYGELNAEDRLKLIGNDLFHIDSSYLENKTLVFLDDIKITGSHEKMITKMLDKYGLSDNETYLLYFAELRNKEIHPSIENYLNYAAVKSIFELDPIVKGNRFVFNTRIVKYILNTDAASFRIFIQDQSPRFINHLYDLAIGNGYHNIDSYKENLSFIMENWISGNKESIKIINRTTKV